MRNRSMDNNNYTSAFLYGLAMGTAIGTSLGISQRMARHHQMPNRKIWQRALIEKHSKERSSSRGGRR